MMVDTALRPLNYATYDMNVFQDLYYNSEPPVGGVPREFFIAFARFQPGGVLISNVFGFNNAAKWTQVSQNWE